MGLSSSPPHAPTPTPYHHCLSLLRHCIVGRGGCLSIWGPWLPLWPWVSDSLVFEIWPLTWRALLCWPGPLLACGMCPHPLLLMVARLSPPCGFLVLILSGAMDSTLETFKVLQLPEPTGHLRHTALDPPLVSTRTSGTGQIGTVKCCKVSWAQSWVPMLPIRSSSAPPHCFSSSPSSHLLTILRCHSLKSRQFLVSSSPRSRFT